MTIHLYKARYTKWPDDTYLQLVEWCNAQFGKHNPDRWTYRGSGNVSFRDEDDFVKFMLRFG